MEAHVVPTCKRELKLGMVAPSRCHICCPHVQERVKTRYGCTIYGDWTHDHMVKSHMLCHWGKMTCHNYGSTCSHLSGGVIWGKKKKKKKNDVESRYQAFTTKWVFTKTSLIELFGSYLYNLSAICGDRTHDHVVKSHALYHWAKMACHNKDSTCYRHMLETVIWGWKNVTMRVNRRVSR